MIDTAYQAALDDIYATFMRVKHLNKGRFDRDARQPQRLLAIARERGIIPPPERTIKVSGSKGKGTTARIAARLLQNEQPDAKIGLFVSPEEDDHNDRMRINGVAMTRDAFVRHYNQLKPQLKNTEAGLSGPDYLSPLGIFLLIALDWFYAEGVDYFVLETGRGVAHDEVGRIPSKVGILTSIMLEHADKLGPTVKEIANDKLSLCDTSDLVVAPLSVRWIARRYTADRADQIVPIKTQEADDHFRPRWLHDNVRLARAGVTKFIGRKLSATQNLDLSDLSASFGVRNIKRQSYIFEALIHSDSLSPQMFAYWQRDGGPVSIIASFPDDKDREHLLEHFKGWDWPITECVLTGTRGYLDYARTAADESTSRVTFAFDDIAGFADWLSARPAAATYGRTYLVGTQTYIRLVRKALTVMAQTGDQHGKV
jgi:hypothetical protein